jgi:hypothetical protein
MSPAPKNQDKITCVCTEEQRISEYRNSPVFKWSISAGTEHPNDGPLN